MRPGNRWTGLVGSRSMSLENTESRLTFIDLMVRITKNETKRVKKGSFGVISEQIPKGREGDGGLVGTTKKNTGTTPPYGGGEPLALIVRHNSHRQWKMRRPE